MNNPELYNTTNILQKRDAQQCLEEYAKEMTWKHDGDTVIDIGCADGSVTTSVLKAFIPNKCKELVGCDISEKMVQFAQANHARDFVKFLVLDIESDLPEQLLGRFDHAFSFYTLHWIRHQKFAFSNIYDLLVKEGDCLLMFLGHHPVYIVWRQLACAPRWKYLLKDVDRFVSPYHDSQEPEKDIKIMMSSIGFTNIEVKCLQKEFVYRKSFKNAMGGINPFKIPLEMQDDFLEDFVKVVHDMKLVDHSNNNLDGTFTVKMNYELIIAYGFVLLLSFIKLSYFKDPEKDIKIMMSTMGFANVEVKYKYKEFIFNEREAFKTEMEEVFLEDYLKGVRDMQLVDHTYNNNEDGTFKLIYNYKLYIVYDKK